MRAGHITWQSSQGASANDAPAADRGHMQVQRSTARHALHDRPFLELPLSNVLSFGEEVHPHHYPERLQRLQTAKHSTLDASSKFWRHSASSLIS